MARMLGNLIPDDEYTHPLGSEENFNESMYFNFFDPARSTGGFVRLGNRANEGLAEMTVCLYPGGGRALFQFERAPIENNDAFDAGGLRFDVIEPTETLRTRYRGQLLDLPDPRIMADPGRAFRECERQPVTLDLTHRASGPLYGGTRNHDEENRDAEAQFAKAHYEQHMKVQGSLEIAGRSVPIEGYGLRDHSWGPRHWQAIQSYDWLTMNFGSELGAMVSIIRRGEGNERRGGVVVRNGELEILTDVSIEVDYETNGLYHRALRVSLATHKGEKMEITGEVHGFVPLRNRRAGMLTHIGEGMTRWQCGERVGWGLSELLRQVR